MNKMITDRDCLKSANAHTLQHLPSPKSLLQKFINNGLWFYKKIVTYFMGN